MFEFTKLFQSSKNQKRQNIKVLNVLRFFGSVYDEFNSGSISADSFHKQFVRGIYDIIDISGISAELIFNPASHEKKWHSTENNEIRTLAISKQLFFLAEENPVYNISKTNSLLKHILTSEQENSFKQGYLFKVDYHYLLMFYENGNNNQQEIEGIFNSFINRISQKAIVEKQAQRIKRLKNEQQIVQQKLLEADKGLRRRTYEISNILEISNELYSILDLDRLMNSALLILVGQIGCEKAFALLNQPDEGTFAKQFSKGFGAESVNLPMEWNHPLVEYLTKRKQPVFASDIAQLPEMESIAEQLEKEQIHILAPIIYSDSILGVIGCGNKIFGTEFDENDLQVFSILVNIVSVSVSNARIYENVKQMSLTDALTDLNNYRSFELRLKEEINRSRRKKTCVSLLMLDIDNFKNYNDSLGHQAGDEALRKVGRILKTVSREEDIVNRYGGEEFSIVLPDVPKDSMPVLAERIRKNIEMEEFYKQEVQPGQRLTVSLGGATLPDDADDFDSLVLCADKALYISKQNGRNTFTLYQ